MPRKMSPGRPGETAEEREERKIKEAGEKMMAFRARMAESQRRGEMKGWEDFEDDPRLQIVLQREVLKERLRSEGAYVDGYGFVDGFGDGYVGYGGCYGPGGCGGYRGGGFGGGGYLG